MGHRGRLRGHLWRRALDRVRPNRECQSQARFNQALQVRLRGGKRLELLFSSPSLSELACSRLTLSRLLSTSAPYHRRRQ